MSIVNLFFMYAYAQSMFSLSANSKSHIETL